MVDALEMRDRHVRAAFKFAALACRWNHLSPREPGVPAVATMRSSVATCRSLRVVTCGVGRTVLRPISPALGARRPHSPSVDCSTRVLPVRCTGLPVCQSTGGPGGACANFSCKL